MKKVFQIKTSKINDKNNIFHGTHVIQGSSSAP